MLRLFAALAVPDFAAERLVHAQSGLDGARWRPPDSLHVTLRFFGDVREDQARDLDGELAAAGQGALPVSIQGVGAFGEGADIRAVWAGVEATAELRHLAERCERAARRSGLKAERRAWRPHVTLAYLRRPDPAAVAAWIQAMNLLRVEPFVADAFGLYSSHRTAEGSVYRLEAEYPL